jgi:hypothetical protein
MASAVKCTSAPVIPPSIETVPPCIAGAGANAKRCEEFLAQYFFQGVELHLEDLPQNLRRGIGPLAANVFGGGYGVEAKPKIAHDAGIATRAATSERGWSPWRDQITSK